MMYALNHQKLLILQALAAAAALSLALVSQYVFLLHPCELCIFQRIPYAVIVAVGLLAAWRVPSHYVVLFCALLFAVDASIAFYHTGVEYDIFKGPDACSNAGGGEKTLEEMRAEIMGAPLVSCKQAMVYVLGLSMAAWNGLAASGFFLLSIMGVIYVKRTAR